MKKGGSVLKIKLAVSKEHYEAIKTELQNHGITIDDEASLVLKENKPFLTALPVKDCILQQRIIIPVKDIIYIETFGHTVEVHTKEQTYQAFERLYQIYHQLDPAAFLRISNSVVIATDQIKKITPTLFMKFILTMTNGAKVDVTRSYYDIFKEYFGI